MVRGRSLESGREGVARIRPAPLLLLQAGRGSERRVPEVECRVWRASRGQ